MSKYIEVTLSEYERMHQAPVIANWRWIESVSKGRKDQHGIKMDGLEAHLLGALGEMAYAKAQNVYYRPTVNTFHAPDIDGVQIRCALGHGLSLIIRPTDGYLDYFVLVTMEYSQPSMFRVYGGMQAGEAKDHDEWYRTFDDRPPAWFVPQSALYTYSEKVTRE